jgi:hypothetical protein
MRLKISQIEIFSYILSVLLLFLVLIANVLLFKRVNTRKPTRANLPDVPELTVDPQPVEPSGNPLVGILDFLQIVVLIGLGILIILFLYRAAGWYRYNSFRFSRNKEKVIQEQIKKIKDARTRAYEIIEKGLKSGNYTSAFIEAYHALDESLDYFREIRRPKYWTPKEYAYSVSEPVFQASVYRFVDTFYRLRYGMQSAERDDLLNFRLELDYLFVDDVPDDVKQSWITQFDRIKANRIKYQIPRLIDPTKPRGEKQ